MGWDEKEEWRQKFLQVLAGFRLLDDDFMTAAFQDNLECVDLVLQIILDKPQIKATKVTTQDTLKNLQRRSGAPSQIQQQPDGCQRAVGGRRL